MELFLSLIAAIAVVLLIIGIVVGGIAILERSFLVGTIFLMTLLTVSIWISIYSEVFLQ